MQSGRQDHQEGHLKILAEGSPTSAPAMRRLDVIHPGRIFATPQH